MKSQISHLISIITESLWAFGISLLAGMRIDGSSDRRLGPRA